MKTYYLISLDDDFKPIHTMKMVSRDDVTADSLPDYYKAGCAKLVVARDIEDAQLTKPHENVTYTHVACGGDSLIDRIDDMLSVQPDADGCFKNLYDIQMLISRDEAAEIKRALAQQSPERTVENDTK